MVYRRAAKAVARYGPAVQRIARAGVNAYRAYSKFTGKRNAAASAPQNNVTFQHDYASIYKRKRAPKRVRRRARKAVYRFDKQLVSSLGQKTWNRTDTFASGTITPTTLENAQSVFDVGMFGGLSTSSNTWGDLFDIAAGIGTGIADLTGKIWFKSCCMDVQIRNSTSSFTTNPAPTTLVVDLYTLYARREGYFTPGVDWTGAMSSQDLLDVGGTLATPLTLNSTPFDAPGFGSSWLIAKKTRYRISPGNSVYLQMRESKSRVFDTARFEYDGGLGDTRMKVFKGFTRGYLFVIRSDTPVLIGETKSMAPFSYDVIYTKNYKYAIQALNTDGQVFNP